jgi:hypothetical protein
LEGAFDYSVGELFHTRANPADLLDLINHARAMGKTQTVTMPLRHGGEQETPDWIGHTRQTIATMYALGGHIEMPWDTYLPTPNGQRYFGKPENYADITALIRGMSSYFDDYVDAYVTGCQIKDARWENMAAPVSLADDEKNILVVARVKSGDVQSPVVIHLVDWRQTPEPFDLAICPESFFGKAPIRVRLFTPVLPYQQATHDHAFTTRNYSGLIHMTELAHGTMTGIHVPALLPWGILVVERDKTESQSK